MRVLITGAAGFIGTPVVEALEREHWLHCADIRPMPNPAQGESVICDLAHFADAASAVEGMDAVIHLAVAGGPAAFDTPEIPMAGTVTATANLLEAAQRAGIKRFVLMSSGAVVTGYAPGTDVHVGLPHRYRGIYALSKSLQEHLAEQYATEYGMVIPTLRPRSVVDSRTGQDKYGSVLSTADPSYPWYVCRYDLAEACRLALTAPLHGFQPFHLMATEPGRRTYDADRTERLLGWRPTVTFADL